VVSLSEYRRKRDFGRTTEPSGGPSSTDGPPSAQAPSGGGRFVVQRHRARALHYDFRLEIDGVLTSWAVPKGPTLDASVKRAAFKVEDHPLEYIDFEGTIPAGQYGAGDVVVWDQGRFEPETTDDPAESIRAGELKFVLRGHKLRGRFTIVRTGDHGEWLLIKKRDEESIPGWDTEAHPNSVRTGRTHAEVAAWIAAAAEVAGARAVAMPDFIEPMKATPADRAFSNEAWLFELKWDGYRVQAHIRDGRVALFTKRGHDAAALLPGLAGPPDWLSAGEAIVDGEVVALNDSGEPDFGLLQSRSGGTLVYEVFDLLYIDGTSLLGASLEDRKAILRSAMRDTPNVRYASHVEGDGEAFYDAVTQRGLEGMVAKLRRSAYEPGRRSPNWLKVKNHSEQEFVIGGWTPRTGTESDLGALIVGTYDGSTLRPAGKVGTGFDAAERTRLMAILAPLAASESPFRPAPREKTARWVRPELVARIRYADWPAGGSLRAPSYKGLDEGVDPAGVAREVAVAGPEAIETGDPGRATGELRGSLVLAAATSGGRPVDTGDALAALDAMPAAGGTWTVAGRTLKLSNLDKLLWPNDGITKRDLIRYYVRVAPYALPYLRGRALTVLRHPNGIERPGFWQKQVPGHAPDWIDCWTSGAGSSAGGRDYAVVDSAAGLAWLANEAAIDLHPSAFLVGAPDRPTWAFVDIDPGESTSWEDVLILARLYRTALEHLGLAGFPKVTGQRGIQIWIPVRPSYTFDQTRDWVGVLSRAIASTVPELVSWEWEKARRSGLARLDYTQNASNKTLVAPYAVRPVSGAPVSTPISWPELELPDLRPNAWTIRTIFERLASVGDLMAGAPALEQDLPAL
jgi:bifunctional non-homologous end joining protein LigD